MSVVGLFLICFASGGIKTNQNVFGANQFELPEQESQLNTFFSVQYFAVKCGLLAGQITLPVLRNHVECFEMEHCFPLAFLVPAVVTSLSLIIFLNGRNSFHHVELVDNMFVKVCGCILVSFDTFCVFFCNFINFFSYF